MTYPVTEEELHRKIIVFCTNKLEEEGITDMKMTDYGAIMLIEHAEDGSHVQLEYQLPKSLAAHLLHDRMTGAITAEGALEVLRNTHENVSLLSIFPYNKEGQLHGMHRSNSPQTGELIIEGRYENGAMIGEWFYKNCVTPWLWYDGTNQNALIREHTQEDLRAKIDELHGHILTKYANQFNDITDLSDMGFAPSPDL